MSLESSIIELFKRQNEPFYTTFIVPLKQKTLRNVIAIFLFNNFSFKRNKLEGILKGVVQQLTFDQLQVFNSSLESLKNKKEGILFVKNDGFAVNIDPSIMYSIQSYPLFIYTEKKKLQCKKALQYINIKQIVLQRQNELESQSMLRSLGMYSMYIQRENAKESFLKLKDDIDKFSTDLFNQIISDNEDEGVVFLEDILDFKKYDESMYDSIIKKIEEKFRNNQQAQSKEVYKKFEEIVKNYKTISTIPETIEEFAESIAKRSPNTNVNELKVINKAKEVINKAKEVINKAKELLNKTYDTEKEFIKKALELNKFGKRRRSYKRRQRASTRRRSNKRKSKGRSDLRSAPNRGRSNLRSAPTRGRSKKKYCHR